jgi:hypothetical protein
MADESLINYNLPTDAYLNFDAQSFKSYIINKLSDNGWFTDQQFEGSNLNNLIDIIAYANNTLLFYLNQTSKETLFSDVEFYENMNRLVKLIGYKPSGFITSTLGFNATSTLNKGTYSIPRYSYFNIDGVSYSLIKDGTFVKIQDGEETLSDFSNSYILYNGKYEKISDYTALGENGEIVVLNTTNKLIDSKTINVYVKSNNKWTEWTQVEDLYFSEFNETNFSVRINEDSNYDIQFGDGINGQALQSGDIVSIYYLNSQGEEGEISQNFLSGTMTLYSTPHIDQILSGINSFTYITSEEISDIIFTNPLPSTNSSEKETVEDIRNNASIFYQSQNRLISKNDFTSFVKNNYSGIISSVKVINNREFLESHIGYLSKIGVVYPFEDGRILTNQYFFSTPCNFNNVYIYAVPRVEQKYSTLKRLNYLNPAQKQSIIDSMENKKEISLDIIIHDPVYFGVDIGVSPNISTPKFEDINNSILEVKTSSTNIDIKNIKTQIINILKTYFLPSNFELGQLIDIQTITNNILSISGISSISTKNGDISVNGLNFYIWDVVYDTNYTSTSQNYKLEDFQYAFFYNLDTLSERINVING